MTIVMIARYQFVLFQRHACQEPVDRRCADKLRVCGIADDPAAPYRDSGHISGCCSEGRMSTSISLSTKTAIVTGGATLFGTGVVAELVAAGAQVVVADIDEVGGAAVAEKFDRAAFVRTDITSDESIRRCVSATVERFGSLDVLVNLACSYGDDGADTDRATWLRTLDVNVVSAVLFAATARPHLARSRGAIVNLSSISAKVAQAGRWVYPASKAAIAQVTRNMALDYAADGIRVNSVSPGWTWSKIMDELSAGDRAHTDSVAAPFHVLARTGDPSEVGRVIAFLASEAASFVTGADWAVDGGYSALGPEQTVSAIPRLAAESAPAH
ncbi:SDR family oxidoreductase [Nocardia sp. NPDC059228]|uniref:SDR family oxidoreductase n=2 Tax=Actinomycetes TaxID=1760 RepID=UPI00369DBC18